MSEALERAVSASRGSYVPGTPEKYPKAELRGLTILEAEAVLAELAVAREALEKIMGRPYWTRRVNARIARSTARSRRNYKYKGRDPHKTAHNIVRSAIRSGNLVRPTECEQCGSEAKVSGHHEDYDKPLELHWLCSRCHIRLHAGLLTLARGGVSPSGKERP